MKTPSQISTVADSGCSLVKDILDKMLYKYWLNQNNRIESPQAFADFSAFLEQAKAELREKP